MMKTIRWTSLRRAALPLAAAAVTLVTPAGAQYRDYGTPGFSLGVKVGGIIGDTELADKADISARGYLSKGLTEHLSAQVGAGYAGLNGDDFRTNMGMVDTRLVISPFQFSRVSPFAYAGVGGLRYDLDRVPATRTADSRRIGWTTAVPLGAGVKVKLDERVSLDLNSGYTHTFSDVLDASGLRPGKDVFWGVKLGFEIGGHPDPDHDGLFAKAERRAGTSPRHRDTDGDGLDDGEEMRVHKTDPAKADTDLDGLADGVEVKTHRTDPLVDDSDRDGLPDGREVALRTNPLKADSDGDGIRDGDEVAAGTDPLSGEVAVVTQAPGTPAAPATLQAPRPQPIHFDWATATLSPQAQAALKPVVAYLKENGNARLEIRGHSNDYRQAGKALSQRRADAVKEYLVSRGIAANRLETKGLGAGHPVASRATVEGRQQNRRVELVIHDEVAIQQ